MYYATDLSNKEFCATYDINISSLTLLLKKDKQQPFEPAGITKV